MPDSARSRLTSGARQWARLTLFLLVVGPSILLVYAAAGQPVRRGPRVVMR